MSFFLLLFLWMPIWYFLVFTCIYGLIVHLTFNQILNKEEIPLSFTNFFLLKAPKIIGRSLFMAPIHAFWPIIISTSINMNWLDEMSKFYFLPIIFLTAMILFFQGLLVIEDSSIQSFELLLKTTFKKMFPLKRERLKYIFILFCGIIFALEVANLITKLTSLYFNQN